MSTDPAEPSRQNFGAFGIYRFALCVMVVICHTGPWDWNFLGCYAVFGLFILSGYVVSYILTYRYFPMENGVWRFYANRLLRIFPLYACVFAITLPLILKFPETAHGYFTRMAIPHTPMEWLMNVTTLGMTVYANAIDQMALVVPVGWTLGVEMVYWLVIAACLDRPALRLLFALFAILYTIGMVYAALSLGDNLFDERFFRVSAGALPFLTGMAIFRYRRSHKGLSLQKTALVIALYLLWLLIAHRMHYPLFLGFYLNLALSVLLIYALTSLRHSDFPWWLRELDVLAGDLSYPLFLCQVPVTLALGGFFPYLAAFHTWPLFGLALGFSILVAIVANRYIEQPVDDVRALLK